MSALREPVPFEVYEAGVYLHGTKADLAVGDLTDRLRPHLKLAALLSTHAWEDARRKLGETPGGGELLEALDAFLARYGNRGASEIDLSRPRWREWACGSTWACSRTRHRHFAIGISPKRTPSRPGATRAPTTARRRSSSR